MKVIICGGGAIGAATAFFLTKRGAEVVLIERHEVAGAASGKSGGFLALDWNRGTPLDRLARRSFALHAELAQELHNPWHYARLTTVAGKAGARGPATITAQIGGPDTTAVVEPRGFTLGLLTAAHARGAQLVRGAVAGLVREGDGPGERVSGVQLATGETIAGDAVVIALGPWSVMARRWLKLPPVYGVKGHSVVFATSDSTLRPALFLEAEDGGETLTPEIFWRANGTVWACAISTQPGLPVDPAQVVPDEGASERLVALCRRLVPSLADAEVVARQACFRPVCEDGLPLMGALADAPGAYVATGHNVWGILNAPASGEAMADLILDGGAKQVDLAAFAPGRLAS